MCFVFFIKVFKDTVYLIGVAFIVVRVSAFHAVGRGLAPRPGHTKDYHTNGTTCLPAWHAFVRIGI